MIYTKQESFLIERGFKMNLLKTILFIIFGMILIGCGGGSDNEGAVKAARVEDGVPKTEDGRIILSSESNALMIPSGQFEGVEINPTQLSSIIEGEIESISQVYNFSFKAGFSQDFKKQAGSLFDEARSFIETNFPVVQKIIDGADMSVPFITSFSVSTHAGAVYDNFECVSLISENRYDVGFQLILKNCGADQVVLENKRIVADLENIVADKEQFRANQGNVLR